MRHTAIICAAAATLPMAANAQLEIRHDSNVTVSYKEVPFVGPTMTIEDSLTGVSAYDPFSLSHAVSFDDEFLDFDPTASSSFSVDSVTFVELVQPGSPFAFYDVTISGELFRSGRGPSVFAQVMGAQADLAVDIVGLGQIPPSGASIITQYSLTASYETDSDQLQHASLPFLSVQNVLSDENVQVLHTLEAEGMTGSETFSGGLIQGGILRIKVLADPLEILVQHDGITTVTFEGTFRVMANLAPEPCLADTNHDGLVTPADFSAWIAAFNASASECDQNGDEACTPADFSAWIANFNAGCD